MATLPNIISSDPGTSRTPLSRADAADDGRKVKMAYFMAERVASGNTRRVTAGITISSHPDSSRLRARRRATG